jgi:hypothetical protein
MNITVQFPPGMSHFSDRHGNRVTPDASRQASIDLQHLVSYLEAGFTVVTGEFATDEAAIAALQAAAPSALMAKAMSGDMVISISPATKSTAHASAASRTVTITLKDAAGDVHTWFNKAIATGVSIAKTSSAGTATIGSTTLTFVNGVATVLITIGGTWAGADHNDLTIAAATILGYTVAGGTSVETMT